MRLRFSECVQEKPLADLTDFQFANRSTMIELSTRELPVQRPGSQKGKMNVTAEEVVSALKKQIADTRRAIAETGHDEAPVRARVVRIARRYGSPVLDVGTGACACMAVALARRGLRVTAVDRASSAVRMAQERAAGKLSEAWS